MADGDPPSHPHPDVPRPLWYPALLVPWFEVAWATRTAGFFQDDFIFLGQGRWSAVAEGVPQRTRFNWGYLDDALYEHFSPVTRALFWFVARFDSPLVVARVVMLVIIAAVVVGFASVTRAVLGRKLPALLLTLIAVQGLVITRLGSWTTAGFNILPAVASSAFAISFGVRYVREPRRRVLGAVSAGALVVACLDYELAMLVPLFIAIWAFTCGPLSPTPGGVAAHLRVAWWYWLGLFIVSVATLVNYRAGYYIGTLPRGTVGSTLETLWYSAWHGLWPAMLGIWSPEAGDFGAGSVIALAMGVVLLALALMAVGRSVIPAVVLAASGWLVYTAVLGYARSKVNTPSVGIELYYAAFPLLVALLGASEVVARCLAAGPEATAVRSPSWLANGISRLGGEATGVLAVIVVGGAAMLQVNATNVTSVSGVGSASRRYAQTFLDEVDARDGPVAVLSTRVPSYLVFPMFAPFDWASRSLGLLTPDVRWNDNSGGDLHRFDDSGHLVPIDIRQDTPAALVEDPMATTAVAVSDRPGCFRFESPDARVRFAFDVPFVGDDLVVALTGTVSQDSAFALGVVTRDGTAQPMNGDVNEWDEGAFATVHAVGTDSMLGIDIGGLRPGTEVCLEPPNATSLTQA